MSSGKGNEGHLIQRVNRYVSALGKCPVVNIPKDSLIIMDNAPYHNVLSPHSAPTASCKKAEICAWLMKNRIPVREDCLKAE